MKSTRVPVVAVLPLILLAGCVIAPTGPSVMVLPGSSKSFEQFRADEMDCRQYAQYQTGGRSADQAAVDAGVRSAALGTVVGAAAGAAIGGHNGAGVGAGTGLLFGSMAGTGGAQSSAYGTQRQYDNAYIQCMYARGHQVPLYQGQIRSRSMPESSSTPPPPPPGYPPPPPPNYAAPPPGLPAPR